MLLIMPDSYFLTKCSHDPSYGYKSDPVSFFREIHISCFKWLISEVHQNHFTTAIWLFYVKCGSRIQPLDFQSIKSDLLVWFLYKF
jgi:hypothetical protein